MRKVGLEVDMQVSDWGTMMQRVFKKEPIEQGVGIALPTACTEPTCGTLP